MNGQIFFYDQRNWGDEESATIWQTARKSIVGMAIQGQSTNRRCRRDEFISTLARERQSRTRGRNSINTHPLEG